MNFQFDFFPFILIFGVFLKYFKIFDCILFFYLILLYLLEFHIIYSNFYFEIFIFCLVFIVSVATYVLRIFA